MCKGEVHMKKILSLFLLLVFITGCESATFDVSGTEAPTSLGESDLPPVATDTEEGDDAIDRVDTVDNGAPPPSDDALDEGELIQVLPNNPRDNGDSQALICRHMTPEQIFHNGRIQDFFSCDSSNHNIAVCEVKRKWGRIKLKNHCLCEEDLEALMRSCGRNYVFLGDCDYLQEALSQN